MVEEEVGGIGVVGGGGTGGGGGLSVAESVIVARVGLIPPDCNGAAAVWTIFLVLAGLTLLYPLEAEMDCSVF